MKAVLKFSIVFSATALILTAGSSASSFVSSTPIAPISEPVALMLIGCGLVGLGSFFRKMKTDSAS